MKAKYRIVTSIENKNNAYTPVQVMDLRLVGDRRKKLPHTHLRVSVNLVHGLVDIEAPDYVNISVQPFSCRKVRITRP